MSSYQFIQIWQVFVRLARRHIALQCPDDALGRDTCESRDDVLLPLPSTLHLRDNPESEIVGEQLAT